MATALIIVDVQNDFCAGGALAVPDADAIIPVINQLREKIKPDLVVLTQDWHDIIHTSFADNNPGIPLFSKRADGQMMWPQHCVKGTAGAAFHKDLKILSTDRVVQKGANHMVDSYSGFGSEPDKDGKRKETTELDVMLLRAGVKTVYVVGLAFDYCVAATAKDAAALGYVTTVIRSATRAVAPESAAAAETEMRAAGVIILEDYTPAEVIRVHQESQARLEEAVERLKAVDAEETKALAEILARPVPRPREPWWRRLFCFSTAVEVPAQRGHPSYGNRRGPWEEDAKQEVTCHLCGHKERKTREGWRAEGWTSKVCAATRR